MPPYSPTVVEVVQPDHSCVVGVQAGGRIDTLIVESKRAAGIFLMDNGWRKVGTVYSGIFLADFLYQLVLKP